jgi:hypothetical protein
MSDSPILVAGRALPQTGTVNSPLVMPAKVAQSNIVNAAAGAQTSVYKVKMIANGKTFNMLLPPSIESKHPGRSNPIQLPGLLIKAVAAISKTKIPGFFPIYQHLGVDSLMISMSGMFTGYDGTQNLSTAFNWEGWPTVDFKEEQDAAAAISEFYDFAVRNKALVEVIINTSDGSFVPKKTESTAFRDSQSNIKFKGYVKEFEAVHVRQDRAYYMIKFEVIDLNRKNECSTPKKINNNLLNSIPKSSVGVGDSPTEQALDKILKQFSFLYPNNEKAKEEFFQLFNRIIEFNAVYPDKNSEIRKTLFTQLFNDVLEFNAIYPNEALRKAMTQTFNEVLEFNAVFPNKNIVDPTNINSLNNQLKDIYSQENNSELYDKFLKNGNETTLGEVKQYLDLFVFDNNIKISYLGNTEISALSLSQSLTQKYGLFKVENTIYYAVPIPNETPKKYTLRILTDYDENFRERL